MSLEVKECGINLIFLAMPAKPAIGFKIACTAKKKCLKSETMGMVPLRTR